MSNPAAWLCHACYSQPGRSPIATTGAVNVPIYLTSHIRAAGRIGKNKGYEYFPGLRTRRARRSSRTWRRSKAAASAPRGLPAALAGDFSAWSRC